MVNFSLKDSDSFEEWAATRRAHFSRHVLDALSSLATLKLEMGDFQGTETAARRQIEIDNLRGVGYRQLMTDLARTGRGSGAAAAYQGLKVLTQAELNIGSSKESRYLMKSDLLWRTRRRWTEDWQTSRL